MLCHIRTAWFSAALSTLYVVCGVEVTVLRTGIMFSDLLQPLFIANSFDPIEIVPKLDAVRHGGLKPCHILARVFFACAAKIDATFCRACGHSAFLAVGQPLSRAASMTRALFDRPTPLRRKPGESFGSSVLKMNHEHALQYRPHTAARFFSLMFPASPCMTTRF